LRYFGAYDWYLTGYLSNLFPMTKIIVRGYTRVLHPPPWDPVQFAADVKKRMQQTFNMGFDEQQKRRFVELIKAAPQRQFILVYCPLQNSFFNQVAGEMEYQQQLKEFAQLSNVHILDFSRLNYSDRNFMDTSHLNEVGAEAFSRMLRGQLAVLGINGK
jgi:hypothetical protein